MESRLFLAVMGMLAATLAHAQPPPAVPDGMPPPPAGTVPAANPALAWPPPSGGYIGPTTIQHHSSTVVEGARRGLADVIRAEGEYNYLSSQAAVFANQARALQLQNARDYVQTYFDLRRMNRMYRALERGPRPSLEAAVRYAQATKPDRLDPGQFDRVRGSICWPILLQADQFAEYRTQMEALFATRAELGSINTWGYLQIDRTAKEMLEELKTHADCFPPQDYICARRFIESLAYEAKCPSG